MNRVGIKDVAQRAGVSISTVSNALNKPGTVSAPLVERVTQAATELGYVPLQAAQQLRARRSGLLGMTVINIANPFFAELMAGAEEAAAAAGKRVLVGNSDDDAQKERDYIELFERVHVEGALIAPFADNAVAIERLRARGIPVVLVDSVDEEGALSSVSFDDVAGGRMAAEHLISLGRRRLAFLGAREEVRQVRERLRGVREAVAAHSGVELDVIWTKRTTPDLGDSWGARYAHSPALDRPDGVIATNDLLACGVVSALVSRGVRVPEDLAVIGYDDIEFARVAAVPLTSIRQPARDMGRRAGEILLAHAAGSQERVAVSFSPTIIVRASTVGVQ
ncbi:LacI family transcriptional regulator [Microbacterium halimionae]|uniref:LacI family transcriptional regulator n=1 Tax=Microbacterium halimionae TaxID=1526413 RepID=A0A7W3JQL9_9MICO|nr:LacI family DNA-binding transcriptional regulator [Microbacterium halimionae]MBA8817232.1 LacI family transcriptional regulator [Microbacterium halimionae]NII94682.1 LacI family transcriptional regulator [Microbacterium halimionae]